MLIINKEIWYIDIDCASFHCIPYPGVNTPCRGKDAFIYQIRGKSCYIRWASISKWRAPLVLIFSPNSFYWGDKGYGIFAPARRIHPGVLYITFSLNQSLRYQLQGDQCATDYSCCRIMPWERFKVWDDLLESTGFLSINQISAYS